MADPSILNNSDSTEPDTHKLQNNNQSHAHTCNNMNENDSIEEKHAQIVLNVKNLSFTLDEIDEKYISETQKIYFEQCPSLKLETKQKQLSLFKLLSIQRKNHNYPLMSYLIDCYLRDRLHYYLTTDKTLTILQWSNFNESNILEKLLENEVKQNKLNLKHIITSAMQTYLARYCTAMIFPTFHKINDSMQRFVECIHEIGSLIGAIKKNPIEILPLQIDLLIIPQNVIEIGNASETEQSDEESPSEIFEPDDTDSEDDSDSNEHEPTLINKKSKTPIEEIGNIKLRLENNNILYSYNGEPNPSMKREFIKLYSKYQRILNQSNTNKKSNYKMNNGHAKDSAQTYSKQLSISHLDNLGIDLQRIPHRKRFCIVVDRRNDMESNEEIKQERNEIYLFEPNAFNKIPRNHSREWYVESSYQCIIPGYNKNCNHITTKIPLDGWINIFSFHVETEQDIRCCLYRNAQMLRFMPNDVIQLFPHLFNVDAFKNKEFIQNEKNNKKNIERINKAWNDTNFDNFRKQLR